VDQPCSEYENTALLQDAQQKKMGIFPKALAENLMKGDVVHTFRNVEKRFECHLRPILALVFVRESTVKGWDSN